MPEREGLDPILQHPRALCWSTWALHPCLPLPNPTRYHRPRANSSSAAPSLPPRVAPELHCLSKVTLQPQEVPQTYLGHLSPSQLLAWGVAHCWLYKHAWHGSCFLHQGDSARPRGDVDRLAKTGCLRDSQAATQRVRGVPCLGCLLQDGPVLPGRAEGHSRGPRAWILFKRPITGPPCPLCWLPESGGFCPGPIYKLPVLCKVLGDPLISPCPDLRHHPLGPVSVSA